MIENDQTGNKNIDETLKDINNILVQETFIYRYFLKQNEIYQREKYLTAPMRLSIFEAILTKYLFQNTSNSYTLFPYLDNVQNDNNEKSNMIAYMKFCSEKFQEESPLYFFGELSKEILRILEEDELSLMKFDKYILKIEFLLSLHFENNFYPKQIDQEINTDLIDNIFQKKYSNNYIYSVQSLNTIDNFLSVFEKQSLCTRIENEFPLIRNLFCSEKIYYFYCDKLNREKTPCGNVIKYLLEQLNFKISSLQNSKTKNYLMENYLMMNFYLINHIIQNYPFYLYKKPELIDIYNEIKYLKNWPLPVGNFCNEIIENIINECSFQGITLLNKIRNIYFIDSLDNSINIIETKYFRGFNIIYSNEWNKRNANSLKSENPNVFNLVKLINFLKNDLGNDMHRYNLVLRELVIKIFISFIFNSKQEFTDENFKNIYNKFLPNYKSLYSKKITDEKKEDEEENLNINNMKIEQKNIYKEQFCEIKPSIDKLLKIIDIGFDKSIDDFNKEINIISEKILNINSNNRNANNDEDDEENILESEAYLPISSFRSYLKPIFLDIKKLYRNPNEEEQGSSLNIMDIYINNFTYVVKNYFSYFLQRSKDENIEKNMDKLRKNFYNNFRVSFLLFEEDGCINDLLENFQKNLSKSINQKITNEEYDNFWKFFVDNKNDVFPKFLLYTVPHYESYNSNPFRILQEEDNIENDKNYLSEFIASKDNIYKNIIFMPFSSTSDSSFFGYIASCQNSDKNVMNHPSLKTVYSFLINPLNYYLGDSNGLLNLDIYEISLNDNSQYKKLFWKNAELLLEHSKIREVKLSLFTVDNLGLEDEDDTEILLNNNFDIKIFNLFFRKNTPFNYNMNSNNDWLEMFLNDNYNKAETEKYCNYKEFLKLNNKTNYFEEYNTTETNLETIFKNYKIKKIIIETNSPDLLIKYDDNYVFEYKNKIDFKAKKNKKDYYARITIKHSVLNRNKFKLPVGTFTTI